MLHKPMLYILILVILNVGTSELRTEKPESTVSGVNLAVWRPTTSANERMATGTRCGASSLPEALLTSLLEKVNCARRYKKKLNLKKLRGRAL